MVSLSPPPPHPWSLYLLLPDPPLSPQIPAQHHMREKSVSSGPGSGLWSRSLLCHVHDAWFQGSCRYVLFTQLVMESKMCMLAKTLRSCLTLCDPMDCSLTGSSSHGILQARILKWVAMPFLQGIFPTQGSNPDLSCLLH